MATPCWPAPVSAMIPLLAHAFGQQGLPDGVVDFVGTGVGQIFSLQEDGGPTDDAGQLGARRQWRGPTHIVLQKSIQFRRNS